ncbi:MAG: AMP-binding protein [Crocinitomicaceae bacterium]|nr:AMP-binding protein [Crocinitomicaceae bacterium]
MLNDLILIDGVSKDFLREVKNFIEEWLNESESIEVTTSGSTGTPKTIKLEKDRIRASAKSTGEFFQFEKGQVALLNLSPQYIAGKLMIVRAVEHEMKLAIAPLQANPLENIPDDLNIDFGAFVPSQIAAILKNPKSTEALGRIKNVIIGGAPLHSNLENELTQLPVNIYASFGMTETITHFALRKLGTPIYRCLNGFSVGIDNRSCLVVHENEIVKRMLVTNDVVDIIDHMTFKWKGRYDNVINSGGVKIYPERVEKMIAHLLPENRFYVTSKQDDKYGEVAVLVVEGDVENEAILSDAKASLPRHHAPKELIVEDQLEETPTNKIIRKKF